jgi:hypothetical protein
VAVLATGLGQQRRQVPRRRLHRPAEEPALDEVGQRGYLIRPESWRLASDVRRILGDDGPDLAKYVR